MILANDIAQSVRTQLVGQRPRRSPIKAGSGE
jgi:hypothetical protein